MTDRIPESLRNRSAGTAASEPSGQVRKGPRRNNDPGNAKIVAAGVSAAAAIGIVGAMAVTAAGGAAEAAAAPEPTVQRVLVIQQPVLVPQAADASDGSPAPLPAAVPSIQVVDVAVAGSSASQRSEPHAVSEGS